MHTRRARDYVRASTQADRPHAACARAFARLHAHDPERARKIYDVARDYVASLAPELFPHAG